MLQALRKRLIGRAPLHRIGRGHHQPLSLIHISAQQADPNAIRIALVCRGDMDLNVSCYQKGMELAIAEYGGPYRASVEIYSDADEDVYKRQVQC